MDRIHRMSRGRKTLLSLLLVGALGAVAGIGTFSAFSATTVNAGNIVRRRDRRADGQRREHRDVQHHGREAQRRGHPVHPVTYTGILSSTVSPVHDYIVNPFGQYVTLSIDKGTMPGATTFPNCTGFTSESNIFSGTLSGFAAGNTNSATGAVANPGVADPVEHGRLARVPFTLTCRTTPANRLGRPARTASRGRRRTSNAF